MFLDGGSGEGFAWNNQCQTEAFVSTVGRQTKSVLQARTRLPKMLCSLLSVLVHLSNTSTDGVFHLSPRPR